MEPMAEPAVDTENQITLKDIKANPEVKHLITGANDVMMAMGYTEHGHRHSGVVSSITRYILQHSGDSEREQELGAIAGYLHDIGNVVNRVDHPMIGASMCYTILHEMGMDAREIAPVLGAIGNHEEGAGLPVSRISAALIIADKSDVHFSRVQNPVPEAFDIHDKVNFAVQKSRIEMSAEHRDIQLTLEINDSATVMEYFEIFLHRMVM
jgi:metal-dependent HD superfamily phosphatase/phosphodiesterase